jgi:hypothetical protein
VLGKEYRKERQNETKYGDGQVIPEHLPSSSQRLVRGSTGLVQSYAERGDGIPSLQFHAFPNSFHEEVRYNVSQKRKNSFLKAPESGW